MDTIRNQLKYDVLSIKPTDNVNFSDLAFRVFKFQAAHCPVYHEYLRHIRCNPAMVHAIDAIPFLPITLFKTQFVASTPEKPAFFFESSGTTGQITSKQPVFDAVFYQEVSKKLFNEAYGDLKNYKILALLPSYLERGNSSLVFMVKHFQEHASEGSGFYLNHVDDLIAQLDAPSSNGQKTLLLGVTFALLDMAETSKKQLLEHVMVMETGGMKGRKKEMLREEVHHILGESFGKAHIHSEYGMTELFSQAYSKGNGVFAMPSTMRIVLRDTTDPFSIDLKRTKGAINVIDLANIDTCCFIETSDLGEITDLGFKVTGRMDNSDIRGCNLMVL